MVILKNALGDAGLNGADSKVADALDASFESVFAKQRMLGEALRKGSPKPKEEVPPPDCQKQVPEAQLPPVDNPGNIQEVRAEQKVRGRETLKLPVKETPSSEPQDKDIPESGPKWGP